MTGAKLAKMASIYHEKVVEMISDQMYTLKT